MNLNVDCLIDSILYIWYRLHLKFVNVFFSSSDYYNVLRNVIHHLIPKYLCKQKCSFIYLLIIRKKALKYISINY